MVLRTDVLVVGGGPAGSTTATLLARRGLSVTLLEKERHPRFHIGESLLPCNLPILERLGVLEQVRAMGVLKPGAEFACPDGSSRTYHFARALRSTPPHAYQVKRSEFDELLFRTAQRSGVDAREGVRVTSVEQEPAGPRAPRRTIARAVGEDGVQLTIEASYLVDATGRDTMMSKKLGLKRKNPAHGSAAIFGHFRGVPRREGPDGGNITIYWFDHGWIWMIPLRDDVTSVGAVCSPTYLKQRTGSTEAFLEATLARSPEAAARMRGAQPLGEIRATGNYSYTSDRMTGPGWAMVGDAFAFIDPVFSSGVYLAMNSAEHAAELVEGVLAAPERERELQRAFERAVRRGIGTFSWFIHRFTTPALRWIFQNPRNVLRVEEAMISMLAGDVFESRAVTLRLDVVRAIYALRSLAEVRGSIGSFFARRRAAREVFRGGTTPEGQPDSLGLA